ncbi:hypothetical protein Mal4_12630 [Maioricimonas rarisocia]|uniref:Sialate O-acetylesterase domain-containing protein n=1 Tax=Maioricimonas rarisocia TaxID=2528026 RepID=A0A517Z381_9PLAN|nr:sialate O-acetylesterase [Maioricimonas rarisocia]QDU36960.1 hypothetical protein Mal4_12630 [Maioricimonas rarisocia]
MLIRLAILCGAFLLAGTTTSAEEPVKVFLLAGQSNMQGHGRVEAVPKANDGKGSLEWLVDNPATKERFAHLVDGAGEWTTREDVHIWYLGRSGGLRPGFGVREGFIGPELGFGHAVGDALEEAVVLIKMSWGGKSLAKDFRPPSAGGEVGSYYGDLIRLTKGVLENRDDVFPQHAGREFELAGFGWHQGWNDRVNQQFNDEYEQNLAHFIRDIRRDLDAPNLPFVIAETGMRGREEKHPRALSLMKAQAAVAEYEEFRGNVAFVGTRDFWRPEDESPSKQGYHWNSNAETYYMIGEAMGQAMVKLLEK